MLLDFNLSEVNATIDHFAHNIYQITPPNGGDYIIYIQDPDQEANRSSVGKVWRVSIYILDVSFTY